MTVISITRKGTILNDRHAQRQLEQRERRGALDNGAVAGMILLLLLLLPTRRLWISSSSSAVMMMAKFEEVQREGSEIKGFRGARCPILASLVCATDVYREIDTETRLTRCFAQGTERFHHDGEITCFRSMMMRMQRSKERFIPLPIGRGLAFFLLLLSFSVQTDFLQPSPSLAVRGT